MRSEDVRNVCMGLIVGICVNFLCKLVDVSISRERLKLIMKADNLEIRI
jgi:hypothetical protein